MTFKENDNIVVSSTGKIDWAGKGVFESKIDASVDGFIKFGGNLRFKEKSNIYGSGGINVGGTLNNEETSTSIFGCRSKNGGCCGCLACCLGNASVGPLPVQLTSFVVQMLEDRTSLLWETASELNNSHFIVERLGDN